MNPAPAHSSQSLQREPDARSMLISQEFRIHPHPFSPYRSQPMNSRKRASSIRAVLASQFPTMITLWIACRHPFASLAENSQNANVGLMMCVISDRNHLSVSDPFTVGPILVPPRSSGAAGAPQAPPSSLHSLVPSVTPRRRSTPICSSPGTHSVRISAGILPLAHPFRCLFSAPQKVAKSFRSATRQEQTRQVQHC